MDDLADLVTDMLALGYEGRICDPADSAVFWNGQGLTVRVQAFAEERWIFAGAGIMVRVVADSNGGFSPVIEVVSAILAGGAIEYLAATGGDADVCGWQVEGGFAGGVDSELRMPVKGWLARIS